jgi:hypothetical protein
MVLCRSRDSESCNLQERPRALLWNVICKGLPYAVPKVLIEKFEKPLAGLSNIISIDENGKFVSPTEEDGTKAL